MNTRIVKGVKVEVTYTDASVGHWYFSVEDHVDPYKYAKKLFNKVDDFVSITYTKDYAAIGETVKLKVVRSGDANA